MNKEQGMIEKGAPSKESGSVNDALDGLITLGYSALQAREVLKKIDTAGKSSEQLLREALQKIK
jgi:Holliday junction resolvasome RuvABC DNA-binding subunit